MTFSVKLCQFGENTPDVERHARGGGKAGGNVPVTYQHFPGS